MTDSSIATEHSRANRSAPRLAFVVAGSFEEESASPFRHLAASWGRELETLSDARDELERDPELHLVIAYPDPILVVASVMTRGAGDALEPLSGWTDQTSRILGVFRRFRRRISLVNGHAAAASPGSFIKQLTLRTGLEFPEIKSEAAPGAPEMVAPLALAVAGAALSWDEDAGRLLEELESASLPLPALPRVSVADLVRAFQSHSPEPRTDAETGDLAAENELLLLQLHQVQEEMEATFLTNRKLERQLQENVRQLDSKEVRQLRERLMWVEGDLEAIRGSLSWRMTAPVRRLLGLFTGGSGL